MEAAASARCSHLPGVNHLLGTQDRLCADERYGTVATSIPDTKYRARVQGLGRMLLVNQIHRSCHGRPEQCIVGLVYDGSSYNASRRLADPLNAT